MAITANTYNIVELPHEGSIFYKSLTSEDASTTEEIIAAVTNKTHYLTHIIVHVDTTSDVVIGSGETTGAVTTAHLGTIPIDAAKGVFCWKAPKGMALKCTSGTAITISATAGTIFIEACGKTCVDNLRA